MAERRSKAERPRAGASTVEEGRAGCEDRVNAMAKKKTKKKGTKKSAKKGSKKTAKKTRKKARRTTHRSSTGKKLYAVRKADGTFKDIQQYSRAHAMDIKLNAAGEA